MIRKCNRITFVATKPGFWSLRCSSVADRFTSLTPKEIQHPYLKWGHLTFLSFNTLIDYKGNINQTKISSTLYYDVASNLIKLTNLDIPIVTYNWVIAKPHLPCIFYSIQHQSGSMHQYGWSHHYKCFKIIRYTTINHLITCSGLIKASWPLGLLSCNQI